MQVADKLLVLENGRITQFGPRTDVVPASMASAQSSREVVAIMTRKSMPSARTEFSLSAGPMSSDHQPRALPVNPSDLEMPKADTRSPLRRLVIAGITTILVSFGGFFGWAFFADLSSATVANGTVIVDSKRKTVSHFEGGVMSRLLVQEGDKVSAGQPLIKLEDTRARADLQAWKAGASA